MTAQITAQILSAASSASAASAVSSGAAPVSGTIPAAGSGLKFNLHIIETCNFSCRHCFAHFGSCRVLRFAHWKKIVDNCLRLAPDASFNIAGGEPLMHPDFTAIASYIHDQGRPVSVISNGYRMTADWISRHAPLLSCIGLSIDSMKEETLRRIGRCTRSGKLLDAARLREILDPVKAVNSRCAIKINTVVSALNKHEYMARDIVKMPVSRWKIFKINLFRNGTFSNEDIVVSPGEYRDYVERNTGIRLTDREAELSLRVRLSPHCEAVLESDLNGAYLMIDARGYLVDNTMNDNYVAVADAAGNDLAAGLARLNFNTELYRSRYSA